MEYKKSSLLLKKLKSLHDTLLENEDHPSAIEKELMRSYLRDFYDAFVGGEGATDIFKNDDTQHNQDKLLESRPEAISQTELIQTPAETNMVESKLDEDFEEQVVAMQEPIEQEAKTDNEIIHEEESLVNKLNDIVQDPVENDLLALFTDQPVTDLSDKLNLLPIKDLTKAFSINERYFTIKELFGGNTQLFEMTLAKLNDLSNFQEAGDLLMGNVAKEYTWSEKSKLKKAANFIKLVKRRYQ